MKSGLSMERTAIKPLSPPTQLFPFPTINNVNKEHNCLCMCILVAYLLGRSVQEHHPTHKVPTACLPKVVLAPVG